MKLKIKIKKCNKDAIIPKVINKGEWVDLYTSEHSVLCAPMVRDRKKIVPCSAVEFDSKLIPLGIAMKLPEGFEAIIAPRSSTFKNFGVIQSNMIGIIDNSYSGNNDEWRFPVIAFRDTVIENKSRICQFRIQLSQKATIWQKIKWLLSSGIEFVEVESLEDSDRGGFGSTGIK